MERLLELLDASNINQMIMVAEINRNLGNFEKCMAAIEYIEEPDMKWLKDLFRAECTKKNTFVFQLNDEE